MVYATAQQYRVDALFIDAASTRNFRTDLLESLPGLKYVTVIDAAFSKSDFEWPETIQPNFILSIPEAGSIAYACPEAAAARKEFIFHPRPDVFIEPAGLSVITSIRLKSCPLSKNPKSVSGTPEEQPRSGGAFAFPPQNPDSARIRHAPRGSKSTVRSLI